MAHSHLASTSGWCSTGSVTASRCRGREASWSYANEAGARLCGYGSPEELLAAPLSEVMQRFELFDENGDPFAPGDLPGQLALDGKHPPEVLIRVRERDTGATRWSLVHAFPIAGAPGEVLYAVNLFRDVTDRTDAARRLRFLADASGVLASSLDYEEILVQIARLAVPTIADWCIVWVVDDDGELRTLTFAHGIPSKCGWPRRRPAATRPAAAWSSR